MSSTKPVDARVAFLGVLVLGTSAFIVKDLLFLLILLILLLLMSLPARERLSRYWRGTRGLLGMLLVICSLQVFLVPGPRLVHVHLLGGSIELISGPGLVLGGRVMARLGVLLFSSLLFTSTVSEGEFMDTLASLKVPYPVVFSVNLVIRSLPRLMEAASEIQDAFKMRRVGSEGNLYVAKWRDLGRMVRPLFLNSMVLAHRLGTSLELRGFDGSRPWKRPNRGLGILDLVVLFLTVALLFLSIASAASGVGPSALLQYLWAE